MDIVQYLVSKGAEVSIIAKAYIENFDDVDAMKRYLADNSDIVDFGRSLQFLCSNGYTKMFKRFVLEGERSAFPSDRCDIDSVISCALKVGSIEILAFLLELGVSLEIFQSSRCWERSVHKEIFK